MRIQAIAIFGLKSRPMRVADWSDTLKSCIENGKKES
jgi:hypothetical protein